ncbi:ubiquinone/menaquinone biosynthesis C-methylase UbiE [Kribbella aluminosa]|uniref:Ubiquinone/menaquinone biosynthesis C-methylase UbiE n=1 Tax=Kribbella aluminosa TaxID=416017 RepID=A0ABS4UIT1_9ACTN|nr:methyltransferase domain-containing protein [Kribbella aluminosa]MBP2351510.1 ubiquinone/menaquinone biosynthesis C-methylase UbiE [Kribbella aluminosa]
MGEVTGGPGFVTERGSFRAAHVADQNVERQAFVLDQVAGRPAVRALKAWALEQLAPAAGETAVDVGSGMGEDVLAFATYGARAIGVEPSPGLRAEAARRTGRAEAGRRAAGAEAAQCAAGAEATLRAAGAGAALRGAGAEEVRRAPASGAPEGVEFVDGRAERLPFEDASVDVVRCERVLQHVDEPGDAVREIARVLRPGGRVALIDTDWGTSIIHPADPDVLQRIVDYFRGETANPYSGRRLRGLLVDAGLEITGETAATWIEPQDGATTGFVGMMHTTAARAGVITDAEAAAFTKTLGDAAERGVFHMSLTMYAVSARKP